MNSVGNLLRSSRERQGRLIASIARELCISEQYLIAIENDQVDEIPGLFFYKSFVRQYAALVGVDSGTVKPLLEALLEPSTTAAHDVLVQAAQPRRPVAELLIDLPDDPAVEQVNRPHRLRYRMQWSVAAFVVVLTACSAFYAWWSKGAVFAQAPAQAPAQALSQEPAPALPQAPAEEPEVESAALASAVAADHDVEPALFQVSRQATPAAGSVKLPPPELTLSATELTWLSVTADGHLVFSGVLRASEAKTFSGLNAATLKIGNAAGVDIRWDGRPLGPIGRPGEVRTVLLTPGSFEIL